jgi:hypothetical protein
VVGVLVVPLAVMVALAAGWAVGGVATERDIASPSGMRASVAGAGGLDRLDRLSMQAQAVSRRRSARGIAGLRPLARLAVSGSPVVELGPGFGAAG